MLVLLAVLLAIAPGARAAPRAPGTVHVVAGTARLNDVACGAAAASCVAVGSTAASVGVVVAITDGIPGAPHAVPGVSGLAGVACASAASCVAA